MNITVDDLKEEQRQIVEAIGMKSYVKLSEIFGGMTIYVAKVDEIISRKNRDEQIREAFDGSNHAALAKQYGLTERWVRNIVQDKANELKRKPLDGQVNLDEWLKT